MEVSTAITLLTITVILLSVVIVVLLSVVIVLLIKVSKLVNNLKEVSENAARATDWLSPVKVFSEIAQLIRTVRK